MKNNSNKTHKLPPTDINDIMSLLIGVWRRYTKTSGPNDHLQTREFRAVVESVQELQKGLDTHSIFEKEDYFSDPKLLGAYILYQWVLHYQQGLQLINELPNKPKRVLDLASGPGAFSFAALKQGAREVIAIDHSQQALNLAGEICGRYGFPLSVRKHNLLNVFYPVEGKFDLLIVGHCLQELFPESQKGWKQNQFTWVKQLFNYLTPDGYILFVENSFPLFNQRILALRDQLVEEGYPVQAPCVWTGKCPALQTNNPCYAQRDLEKPHLLKNIQRAAQINRNSLKMSYLIMRNLNQGWPKLPDHPLYRVISPPIDTHAGKRFHLCGTNGKKDLGSHLKEHPPESRAFDYLQRGTLISVEDVLVRKENHFEIVLGSRIKVEAALSKPLPLDEDY